VSASLLICCVSPLCFSNPMSNCQYEQNNIYVDSPLMSPNRATSVLKSGDFCLVFRLREGKTLEESERVKISSSADGVYTLRLCGLTEEDSGKYTIKAVSDAGQTSCTATLLVHGQ